MYSLGKVYAQKRTEKTLSLHLKLILSSDAAYQYKKQNKQKNRLESPSFEGINILGTITTTFTSSSHLLNVRVLLSPFLFLPALLNKSLLAFQRKTKE
jgi:hypothetical protein